MGTAESKNASRTLSTIRCKSTAHIASVGRPGHAEEDSPSDRLLLWMLRVQHEWDTVRVLQLVLLYR